MLGRNARPDTVYLPSPLNFTAGYRTVQNKKVRIKANQPNKYESVFQVTSEFVDAETGLSLGNHPLKKFIQGFSVASRRSVSAKKDGPTSVVRIGSLQPQNNSADNGNSLPSLSLFPNPL